MKNLRAVIVDDESNNRNYLKELINGHCEGVSVVATADTALTGMKSIKEHRPDVVFLDVEMPGGSGFDLLENIDKKDFRIVFVTAYSQYAIKALRSQAVDYLLKPVDLEELQNTLKVIRKNTATSVHEEIPKKVTFTLLDRIIYLDPKEIVNMEGDGSYCTVYLTDGTSHIISKHLKAVGEMLPKSCFFRIHNSHMVNLHYVEQLLKQDGDVVLMTNGHQLPLSRRKKENFVEAMTRA